MWLQLLVVLIPSILQFVQTIHPAKKPDGSSNGSAKMNAAIALAQTAVSAMITSGAIPIQAAPTPLEIHDVAQQKFDEMRAGGAI